MLKKDIAKFLEGISYFSLFDRKEIAFFAEYLTLLRVGKGDFIIKQGFLSNAFYIIVKGAIKAVTYKPSNQVRTLSHLQEKMCFGEFTLVAGEESFADVVAVEDTHCLVFTREMYDALKALNPRIMGKFERIAASAAIAKISEITPLLKKLRSDIDRSEKFHHFNTSPPLHIEKKPRCKGAVTVDAINIYSKKSPLNYIWTNSELTSLCGYAQFIKYDKGSLIVHDEHPTLDIIFAGTLQICDESLSKIAFLEIGDLFGELDLSVGKLSFSAICREETVLMRLAKDTLKNIEESSPSLWFKINHYICLHIIKLLYAVNRTLIRMEVEKKVG